MPFYSDAVLDEVRNSANIVSLISDYVTLKKRGRSHLARCPFHQEKTPSFNVNEEKQIFHCFGCGVGGDVFKFLMLVEHVTFPDAIRMVAERAGVALPEKSTPQPANEVDFELLRRAMAEAVALYHRLLVEASEGRAAREYLQTRGITAATIRQFQLGFAPPGGEVVLPILSKKGFTTQHLEDCGLVKRSEDGQRHYDAFRGRIMFPITDVRGKTIAFGGRAMGDAQPKYLNSPETRLYNKSRNLFGLYFSREGIKRQDFAILVEGYMDFVIPFQAGIDNLIASLGTSLTSQQVKLLGRYTREVVVSYDADSAGIAATQRSLDLFLEEDFRVRVFRLPQGEDPDTYVRKVGVEEFRAQLARCLPYLDFVLDTALEKHGDLENPRNKIQVLNAVLPYLAKIPHAVERSDHVFRVARRLRIEDKLLLAEVKKSAEQRRTRLPETSLVSPAAMKFAEKRLLQLILVDAELQRDVLMRCSPPDFQGLATERIFTAILESFRDNEISTFDSLHRRFAGEEEQAVLAKLQMEEHPESRTKDSADSFLNALRTMRLASYKQYILSRIAEAEQRKDDEMLNRLIEQRILLDRELVSLSRK